MFRAIIALVTGAALLGGSLGFLLGRKNPISWKVKIYLFIMKHRKFIGTLSAIIVAIAALYGFVK